MCGRYSLTQTAPELATAFDLAEPPAWTPRYNIAPTQILPTIIQTRTGQQFQQLRWGLIPGWAKDPVIGARLINARAETLAEKPSFRAAFKQRRCLVLADGFYEWKRTSGKKQPFYFQRQDRAPFAFAGLWEEWQQQETTIRSFTIITTQANSLLQPVHDRMPVILTRQAYALWLEPSTPRERLQTLLVPLDPDLMNGYPVSSLVNSPANDQADCIKISG